MTSTLFIPLTLSPYIHLKNPNENENENKRTKPNKKQKQEQEQGRTNTKKQPKQETQTLSHAVIQWLIDPSILSTFYYRTFFFHYVHVFYFFLLPFLSRSFFDRLIPNACVCTCVRVLLWYLITAAMHSLYSRAAKKQSPNTPGESRFSLLLRKQLKTCWGSWSLVSGRLFVTLAWL